MMHSKQFMKTGFNNQNVQMIKMSKSQSFKTTFKSNVTLFLCQRLMKKKHFALGCPVCDKTPILPLALKKNIHFI